MEMMMMMMEATPATVGVASPLVPLVSTPPEYCYDHDYLTGYLEDALVQFSANMMKRRRLTSSSTINGGHDDEYELVCSSPPSSWQHSTTSSDHHHHQQFDYCYDDGGVDSVEMEKRSTYYARQRMMMMMSSNRNTKSTQRQIAGTTLDSSQFSSSPPESTLISENFDDDFYLPTTTTHQNSNHTLTYNNISSQPYPKQDPRPSTTGSTVVKREDHKVETATGMELVITTTTTNTTTHTQRRRVAYPFATVRPGAGCGGDGEDHIITLDEINRKLLMPPTRPVRHPVGRYACKPNVVSPEGRGLSGKMVVGLTRIQTAGGKGTITIIRTRG